ncbi:DUF421 domain-containing protein [Paenibacillus aquistagni]|uniref:Uncharacterized membrane protein YcaP, DUF421 family n=1 Tax=Paenibacillus aquistagni TaxID=1852522 RepID=A0A1X7KKZ7_9BACL|nr:DUF421 domain-containing protein [Paenibacillus aquistagni]SMG41334.1 Uncharacterized membrane protein YcaP, DUF421 family [Paenibacillus aquistagni]
MYELVYMVVRTWLAMAVLLFMTKFLGKRQVSQLSLFEYMTGLTVGSMIAAIAQSPIDNWMPGFIPLLVWVITSFALAWAQLKSKRFRDLMESKGTVIIKRGRLLEHNMRKERLTIDELMTQLRNHNAFQLSDVEFAIMEPTGDINVMLKQEHRPLTLSRMQAGLRQEQESIIVLMDGEILETELKHIEKDAAWLKDELHKRGLMEKDVFVAEVNAKHELFIDLYKNKGQIT